MALIALLKLQNFGECGTWKQGATCADRVGCGKAVSKETYETVCEGSLFFDY